MIIVHDIFICKPGNGSKVAKLFKEVMTGNEELVNIMGLCGNAVLPLFYGWLADKFDTRQAYWVLFPCYLYLVSYAAYGHRVRTWRLQESKK